MEIEPDSWKRLERKLQQEIPKEVRTEARKFVRKVANDLAKELRTVAPRGESGSLRRSIYVKVLKDKLGAPIAADVRFRTGRAAAKQNRDGFYWRFIEYGTKFLPALPFLRPALERFRARLADYFAEFQKNMAAKFNKDTP